MVRGARAMRPSPLWRVAEPARAQVRRSPRLTQRTLLALNVAARERHTATTVRSRKTPRKPIEPPHSISDHVERKRVLSVTDLVSPSWCEYAYLYNILGQSHLPLWQRPASITTPDGNVLTPSWTQLQAREDTLARGTEIHDAMEREVQPIRLTFRLVSPADEWALYLLQFAAGIHAARTSGCAREVPVLGYVQGRLVRGIVDELRREGTSLLLSDTKTRRSSRLPTELDQLQARLQVMLYKRLVDSLYLGITGQESEAMDPYAEPVSLDTLGATLQLDMDAPLSSEFHADVQTMIQTTATPWKPSEASHLTLHTVLALARQALGRHNTQHVAHELELVYVQRDTAQPLGVARFHTEPTLLQDYLEHLFLLLHGRRAPEGVAAQSTRRCDSCAWREGCEWRDAQAKAALEKTRRPACDATASDDVLWSEFDIPDHHLALLEW